MLPTRFVYPCCANERWCLSRRDAVRSRWVGVGSLPDPRLPLLKQAVVMDYLGGCIRRASPDSANAGAGIVFEPPQLVFFLRSLRQLPNMRLKLSGLLLKESAVPSPGAPPRGGPVPCARGHAARSLSAIR